MEKPHLFWGKPQRERWEKDAWLSSDSSIYKRVRHSSDYVFVATHLTAQHCGNIWVKHSVTACFRETHSSEMHDLLHLYQKKKISISNIFVIWQLVSEQVHREELRVKHGEDEQSSGTGQLSLLEAELCFSAHK